eukprot:COSAG01_NODE_770_length_13726_cov_66.211639_4_plen_164_part_00
MATIRPPPPRPRPPIGRAPSPRRSGHSAGSRRRPSWAPTVERLAFGFGVSAARPPLEGHIWGCLKKSTYSRYRWPCHSQYRSRHPVDRSGSGGSVCGTCGGAVVEGPNRPLEGHRASEACMAGWQLAGFYCSRSLVFRFSSKDPQLSLNINNLARLIRWPCVF